MTGIRLLLTWPVVVVVAKVLTMVAQEGTVCFTRRDRSMVAPQYPIFTRGMLNTLAQEETALFTLTVFTMLVQFIAVFFTLSVTDGVYDAPLAIW